MPAGDRNVNAPVCTPRDRSNYLVKSRESSFPTSAQTPANVDHSRRTWYFFNPAAIELLRQPRVFPSPSFSRASRGTRLFCKRSGEYVDTRRRGKPIDHWGALEGSLLFIVPRSRRIALAEKFRRIWEVSSGGPSFRFGYRCIACLESFSANDLILLIKTNEKKLKFKLSKVQTFS